MAKKTNCTRNGIDYFRVVTSIGYNEKGKQMQKIFYGSCKSEAVAKKDAYLSDIQLGLDTDLSKKTLSAAMRNWLFEVKRVDNDLKASSFARYECSFRNTIVDTKLGAMLLPSIKTIHVQRYLNDMLSNGCTHMQMKNAYKVLRMFFVYATAEGYTVKNPCLRISIPGDKPKKEEVETFTSEEVETIKINLIGHRLRFLILLGFGTGMRKGEMLALRYEDIVDGKVFIKATLAMPKKVDASGSRERSRVIWEPKSESSNRIVPLTDDLLRELESHRIKQIEDRLSIGIGGKSEYIFTTITGQLYDPTNVYVAYSRLLKKAGVPHRKFHALRHTYATQLVRSGKVPLPTVQKLLGHSNIDMTSVYVHTSVDDLTEAVKVLDGWLK